MSVKDFKLKSHVRFELAPKDVFRLGRCYIFWQGIPGLRAINWKSTATTTAVKKVVCVYKTPWYETATSAVTAELFSFSIHQQNGRPQLAKLTYLLPSIIDVFAILGSSAARPKESTRLFACSDLRTAAMHACMIVHHQSFTSLSSAFTAEKQNSSSHTATKMKCLPILLFSL